MHAIQSNLSDPGWWFTAIFVTIVAGVASGFLKERIERLFACLSSRYRSCTSARAQARENLVRTLAENPQFLMLAYLGVAVGLLMHILAVILYLVTIWFVQSQLHDAPSRGASSFTLWVVFMLLLGTGAAYIGFRATARLSLVMRAIALFREKNGLPSVG